MLLLLLSGIAGRMNAAAHLRDLGPTQGADVAVALAFEPERFHIEAFQKVGRFQGWSEGHALIMSADAEELTRLARNYWVKDIRLQETR